MTNKEAVIEKDDCIVKVGASNSESFNFVSGMEECINSIAYGKVNGTDIQPQGVFGSCHKDMAINPDATWLYKFINRGEPVTLFMTMEQAEAKFTSL
jgi:hypothetical protein